MVVPKIGAQRRVECQFDMGDKIEGYVESYIQVGNVFLSVSFIAGRCQTRFLMLGDGFEKDC